MSPELIGPAAAGLLCVIVVIAVRVQYATIERERWQRWWAATLSDPKKGA